MIYFKTATEKPSFQTHQEYNPKRLVNDKSTALRTKIRSLKELSCIETISKRTGSQSSFDEDRNTKISRMSQPQQLNSEDLLPFQFKNYQGLSQNLEKKSEMDSINKKTNKIKIIKTRRQTQKKLNKLTLNHQFLKIQNLKIQSVFDISIPSSWKPLNKHLSMNSFLESRVQFDYQKFYHIKSSPISHQIQQQQSFHPINQNICQFFDQTRQKNTNLTIKNLNQSFIKIINQINSPRYFNCNQGLLSCINAKPNKSKQNKLQIIHKNSILTSELTSLAKEGPRSLSAKNQLKKFRRKMNRQSSSKNNFFVFEKSTESETGKPQFFYVLRSFLSQCFIQSKSLNRQQMTRFGSDNNNQKHRFQQELKSFQKQTLKNQFIEHKKLLAHKPQHFCERNTQTYQRESKQKNIKKRLSKGISVISQEKRQQNLSNQGRRLIPSKLKNVHEIKKVKKLKLSINR